MNPTLRTWLLRISIIPLVLLLLFVAYTWLVLTWHYSEGDRAGYVQKFSKKGWVCKTWEGELAMVTMPGTLAEKFPFTVRDEKVAQQINESMGHRVVLIYTQHVGIPTTCFGETGYFVNGIQRVADDSADLNATSPAPISAMPSDNPSKAQTP